ncbi:MAG TPA: hypothetical protein VN635_01735 [Conexibacter sp.]|nr:hypothetical protein [Conexibacter sp.]
MLMLVSGSAGASRLSLTEGEYDMSWAGLEFRNNLGAPPLVCPTTLSGRFERRTFSKVAGSQIGVVERVSINASERTTGTCRGGEITILTESLPWHINYHAFFGTLPSIRDVRVDIVNAAFRINMEGVATCLIRSEASEPFVAFIATAPESASGPASAFGTIRAGDGTCAPLGIVVSLAGQGPFENRHAGGFTISLI